MAYPRNEDADEAAVAADRLRGFIGEIEASDDRIASENKHKASIYQRAKKDGFNVKAMRKVIAARRMEEDERYKLENDFDLYMMHLSGVAHAHVEIIEEFDPETGEITEGVDSTDALLCSGGAEAARQVHTLEVAGASPAPATNEGAAATETAPDYLREPPAVVSGQITEEGDAPLQAGADAYVTSEAFAGEHLGTEFPTPAGGGNTTEPDMPHSSAPALEQALPESRNELATRSDDRGNGVRGAGGAANHEATGKSEAEQSASAPAKRQWKFNDPAHLDCLNPDQCGGFSNLKLCPGCAAEALSARQVA